MNCSTFTATLERYLLDDVSDFERIRMKRHTETCAACGRRYAEMGGVIEDIRKTVPRPAVDETFFNQVRDAVLSASKHQNKNRRVHAGVSFHTLRKAAVLLVLIVPVLILVGRVSPVRTVLTAKTDSLRAPSPDSRPHRLLPELWTASGTSSWKTTDAHKPVAVGDIIGVLRTSDDRERISALNAFSGKTLWTGKRRAYGYLQTSGRYLFGVCATDEGTPVLTALDPQTGEESWSFRAPPKLIRDVRDFSAPVSAGARIYWRVDRTLFQLHAQSGSIVWQTSFPGRGGISHPLHLEAGLVCATRDALMCLDKSEGTIVTTRPFPERMSGLFQPLVTGNDEVVITAHRTLNNAGYMVACSPQSMQILWEQKVAMPSHLSCSDDVVLARSQNLSAYDARTGRLCWQYPANGCSPVTVAGSCCFLMQAGQHESLVQLDSRTGRLIAKQGMANACAGIVFGGQCAFVNDNTGALHAFDAGSFACSPVHGT